MSWPPVENVYIQFDNNNYFTRQTIFYKAYLSSSGRLDSPCQKNFYVDWYSDRERLSHPQLLLSRMVFQSGVLIYLEPTPEQTFMLLAYTTWMKLRPGFFSKSLGVFLPKNRQRAPVQSENTVQFLPESGNALVNKASVVAFKSVNWLGLPQKHRW